MSFILSSMFFSASTRRFSVASSFFWSAFFSSSARILSSDAFFSSFSSFSAASFFSFVSASSNVSASVFSFTSSISLSLSIAISELLLITSVVACICTSSSFTRASSSSFSFSRLVSFSLLFASSTCFTSDSHITVYSSIFFCARDSSSTEKSCSISHFRLYSSSSFWLLSNFDFNSFTSICRRATTAVASSSEPFAASWNVASDAVFCSICSISWRFCASTASFACITCSSTSFIPECSFTRSSWLRASSTICFFTDSAYSLFRPFRPTSSSSTFSAPSRSVIVDFS